MSQYLVSVEARKSRVLASYHNEGHHQAPSLSSSSCLTFGSKSQGTLGTEDLGSTYHDGLGDWTLTSGASFVCIPYDQRQYSHFWSWSVRRACTLDYEMTNHCLTYM